MDILYTSFGLANSIYEKLSLKLIFIVCLIVFALLLYKDPFSQRTLIPNFEPFPDSFHYIIPTRNLLEGKGFIMARNDKVLASQVAPLYSFYLIPFYFLNNDPRLFYFANILLSLFSFTVFYLILRKVIKIPGVILVCLLLFSTNYYLYWYPTLAMAENLIIFFSLCAAYFIILPVNFTNIFLASLVALSFYLTKYASAPLTVIYLVLYFIKVYRYSKSKKYILVYSIIGGVFLTVSVLYLSTLKHINVGVTSLNYFRTFTNFEPNGVFSLAYVPAVLPSYINAILGNPTKVLWETTPLVPRFISILGMSGLIWGLLKSNSKFLCIYLLIMIAGLILFMSTFYSFDGRYILHVIPILILGFGIFLVSVFNFLAKRNMKRAAYVLLFVFVVGYLALNGLKFKNQIMLNLKYAETPWYYVSVLEMNKYFGPEKKENGKKPVVISAVSPFLIDLFSNNNYSLLPLSYEQEFRTEKQIVWGPNDYSDLPKLYKKYIQQGYPVYVGRYGLGNETYTNRDFKIIESEFNLQKVADGCYEQCNIYRLNIKNDERTF